MQNKTIFQILAIVAPSVMLHALAMDIFVPCVPSMTTALNTDFANIQWALSIFVFATGIGQIFIGPLADKFGRRIVMLTSIMLFLLASFACALANTIETLIIARFFQGLASCGTTVATLAIVRDIFAHETRAKMYGYINSVIALAPLIAPLLGGYLLIWFTSWRASFYFLAIFSLVAWLVSFKSLQETKPAGEFKLNLSNLYTNYKLIFSDLQFLGFAMCAITGLTGLFGFFSISSILLIGKLGVAVESFGYYFGLNAVVFLLSSVLCSRLQKILPSLWHIVLFGSILIIIGSSAMLWWQYAYGLSKMGLMLPNLIITSGVAMLFGPAAALALQPFKNIAGMASAAYGTLEYGGAALIGAYMMQFALDTTLPLAITMLLLGVVNVVVLLGIARYADAELSETIEPLV